MFEVAHTHTHTRGALPRHHPTDALLATRHTLMIDAITNHQSSILATRRTLAAGSRPGGSAVALPPSPPFTHAISKQRSTTPRQHAPLAAGLSPCNQWQSVAISGIRPLPMPPCRVPPHVRPTDSPQIPHRIAHGPVQQTRARRKSHSMRHAAAPLAAAPMICSHRPRPLEAISTSSCPYELLQSPTSSCDLVRSRAIAVLGRRLVGTALPSRRRIG